MLNINSTETFAPLADDNFAVESPVLVQVATVKPSGYLYPRAIVAVEQVADVIAGLNTYYVEQGRDIPTVYYRPFGTAAWLKIDSITSDIPDTLEGLAE